MNHTRHLHNPRLLRHHPLRELRPWVWFFRLLCMLSVVLGCTAVGWGAPYDVVYVRAPRPGGDAHRSPTPDVAHPLALPPGSDLVVLQANTTTPTVLVDTKGLGAVFDPVLSYDGQWVYYALCANVRDGNDQRYHLPKEGCSIYKKHLATRAEHLLVDHRTTWRPLESYATWSTRPDKAVPAGTTFLGYGVYNMGIVPLPSPDGREQFLFTSNMLGLDTIKHDGGTTVSFQLFRYDDGIMEQVWFPPTSVLHPVMLPNGEVAFSTLENHGPRDSRPWGVWSMRPDGSNWQPRISAMDALHARHFCTGTRDMALVCASYYLSFNAGLGTLLKLPLLPASNTNAPGFGPPQARSNPAIPMGTGRDSRQPYTPTGMHSLTPWTHQFDEPAPIVGAVRVGKVGHPWAAPEGDILVSYSPGPAHVKNPALGAMPDLGIYRLPGGVQTTRVQDLTLVINDPQYNEMFARPVVPWHAVYGTEAPPRVPLVRNDGTQHPALPAGTPYALVGSSSVWARESEAGQSQPGWKGQQTTYGTSDDFTNFDSQGGDTKPVDNTEIFALQVIVQGGVPHLSYGDPFGGLKTETFVAAGGNEHLRVLGEVTLLKRDAQGQVRRDPWGESDTSFLVKIPADTSYTFRLVDRAGRALSHAFTWHQARPGEIRNDCGGCHYHSHQPRDFSKTMAGQPGYPPTDLTHAVWPAVEFHTHVAPLLHAKCASCHTGGAHAPGGGLDLANTTVVNGLPRHAAMLVANRAGTLGGYKPVTPLGITHASRYVLPFSALRSLLAWVVFGERSDGFTNDTFLTEAIPGNPATLPPGWTPARLDIDYRQALHDAHTGVSWTPQERSTIAHWIDNGAAVDKDGRRGWGHDVWRPVLAWYDAPGEMSTPPPGCRQCAPFAGQILLGAHDVGSGLDMASLQVTRDGVTVQGPVALGEGRWSLPRHPGAWQVRIKDKSGNMQELRRNVR